MVVTLPLTPFPCPGSVVFLNLTVLWVGRREGGEGIISAESVERGKKNSFFDSRVGQREINYWWKSPCGTVALTSPLSLCHGLPPFIISSQNYSPFFLFSSGGFQLQLSPWEDLVTPCFLMLFHGHIINNLHGMWSTMVQLMAKSRGRAELLIWQAGQFLVGRQSSRADDFWVFCMAHNVDAWKHVFHSTLSFLEIEIFQTLALLLWCAVVWCLPTPYFEVPCSGGNGSLHSKPNGYFPWRC